MRIRWYQLTIMRLLGYSFSGSTATYLSPNILYYTYGIFTSPTRYPNFDEPPV